MQCTAHEKKMKASLQIEIKKLNKLSEEKIFEKKSEILNFTLKIWEL